MRIKIPPAPEAVGDDEQAIWERVQQGVADALKDVSPNVREEALKAVRFARVHVAVRQAQRATMQREAETLESGIQTLHKRLDTLREKMRRVDE